MAATYQDMKDRIANELQRTDLEEQIANAIQQSIAFYQRVTTYQSDAQYTVSTVAGTVSYALPADFGWARDVWIIVQSTRYELNPRSYEYLETEFANTTNPVQGASVDYAIFAGSIYLYPVPDQSTYTIQISYAAKTAAPVNPGDSNFWTDVAGAEAVIRNRAKATLYSEVLINPQLAQVYYEKAENEHQALKEETAMKKYTGIITSDF